MTEFKYEIGGKTYTQRPLVLGQISQLMNLMQGLIIPRDIDTVGIIELLGDKSPLAIATIITPEGKNIKDKDIHALAADLELEMPVETAIQVIDDFFTCNPIVSLLERLSGMTEKISKAMTKTPETGLKSSSAPLPEETSPKETASSGDIP